jgi:branched-chain amino acid transport system ATP-binding protein
MLSIEGLLVEYGNIPALKGIDLDIFPGEFVAILGPNGAGKSTLIKTIMGVIALRAGRVLFGGQNISRFSTAQRIRQGIGTIPEGRQLFSDMTVRENLVLGAYAQLGFWVPVEIEARLREVFSLFPRLAERQQQTASLLSGGEAQMVAIGRALMAEPLLLLCDEPSLGLAPMLVREMLGTLASLRDKGMTILLADQNAAAALRLADRAYVLDTGKVVAFGSSAELSRDDRLRAAYLGAAPKSQTSPDPGDEKGEPR